MTYSILDSTGSAIAAFTDEVSARATLRAIVESEPEAAEHLIIVVYDDAGMPVGDPILFEDLPPSVTVQESDLIVRGATSGQKSIVLQRGYAASLAATPLKTDVRTDVAQPA